MTPTDPALRIDLEGLSLGGVPVLGRIALDVAGGETVALVGPSGIGKSTLLRCICGLQEGYAGTIRVSGTTTIVFQEPTLLPWRDCIDNLRITAGLDRDGAKRMLASVGLSGRGAEFPGRLSLGQQRRLALARAFATGPDLLLLDEPFVSLDQALARDMMDLFEDLRRAQRTATLLVTHVHAEAERLADRIVELGGPPARIVSDHAAGGERR